MGFNIKNNIGGTMIDNHDGGVVNINNGTVMNGVERILKAMGVESIDDIDFDNLSQEQQIIVAEAVKESSEEVQSTPENVPVPVELPAEITSAPARAFNQNSDFIKKRFANAVSKYYKGSPTNIALIAVVADDWGMLRARKQTLDIVRCCFAVGGIPFVSIEDVNRINDTVKRQLNGQTRTIKGVKVKQEGYPCDYKTWTGDLASNIAFCDNVAKEFEGAGMFNRFEKKRELETMAR